MTKLPSLEGLKKFRKRFSESIKKQPSDDLVKIVDESTQNYERDRKKDEKPGQAARSSRDPEVTP